MLAEFRSLIPTAESAQHAAVVESRVFILDVDVKFRDFHFLGQSI